MTFNDFVHKDDLKKKAARNIKTYEVLKKMGLDSKVAICLRDGIFFQQIMVYSIFTLLKERIGFVLIKTVILFHMAVPT